MPALLSPDGARLLAEVGFLAIDQGEWACARQIFSTLMAFRHESEFPYVGMSMVELMQCHWDDAARWAVSGLVQVPGSPALVRLREVAVQRGVPS